MKRGELYAIALHQRQTRANRKDDCNQTLDQSNYFYNLITNTGLKIRISEFNFYADMEQWFRDKARRPSVQIPVTDGKYYNGVFTDAKRKK